MQAAKALIELGPNYILIKKGGNGSMLYSRDDLFLLHAYPLDTFADPTGAGDSFAGGLDGVLAASGKTDAEAIRQAMVYVSVVALWC